jgi:hypothetical protein
VWIKPEDMDYQSMVSEFDKLEQYNIDKYENTLFCLVDICGSRLTVTAPFGPRRGLVGPLTRFSEGKRWLEGSE